MARSSPSPPELRERAVRMVVEIRPNYPTEWPAMRAVVAKLGVGAAETVRTWVRKAPSPFPVELPFAAARMRTPVPR
jgi:transposase